MKALRVQNAVAVRAGDTLAVVQLLSVTTGLEAVKVTAPLNWLRLVTVIVIEPEAPRLKAEFVEVNEKLGDELKLNVTGAVRVRVPLVPEMVTA